MGLFEARTVSGEDKKPKHGQERPGERLNIAFGLERLAFLGLRAPIVALLAVAALYSWHVWAAMPGVDIGASGWSAIFLGAVFTIALGAGLMFLVFYSSRHGYDDLDDDGTP